MKDTFMCDEHCSLTTANYILCEEALKVIHELGKYPKDVTELKAIFDDYRRILKHIIENKSIPDDSTDFSKFAEMKEFFRKLHLQLRTAVELHPINEDDD